MNAADRRGNLVLGCGLSTIDKRHTSSEIGEFTDFYLYLTAQQDTTCKNGAAAWAVACVYDDYTYRPVAGNANICPASFGSLKEEDLVATVVHEVLHAMVSRTLERWAHLSARLWHICFKAFIAI